MTKCVSLETAKRLKEAGWPQDTTDNHWFEYCGKEKIEVKPGLSTNRITGGNFKNYDAPDVSDLLTALPNGVQMTKGLAYGNYYCQDYRERESGAALENEKWQKNPSEALAQLWLALRKEKIVPENHE